MVHLIASEYVSFFVFPSPTAVMFYWEIPLSFLLTPPMFALQGN
jgi:hypothetical protein